MKVTEQNRSGLSKTGDMKAGDVLFTVNARYILRHFSGWVDLTNPLSDWKFDPNFLGVILPVGAKLTLEIEATKS